MGLTWDEYQTESMRTKGKLDGTWDALASAALGLAGEAGEVADQVKKHIFHQHPLDLEELGKEIGDVLWYVALLLDTTGLKMDDILQANIEKLKRRYPDGFDPERSLHRDA